MLHFLPMWRFVFFLVFLISSLSFAYTAKNSTQALLTYRHWVELPDYHSPRSAEAAIKEQVTYLFGPLSMGRVLAAPKGDEKISQIEISQKNGKYIATYTYQGTIVLKNGPTDQIRLALPNDPFTIWQTSVNNSQGKLNPCTDPDYQGYDDFWYFWSPSRPGCEKVLKQGRDFNYLVGKIHRLANTVSSYPEYTKLPDANGRVQITLIMGKDEPSRIRSPYNRQYGYDDLNALNFRKIVRKLKAEGFSERQWTNEEVKAVVRVPLRPFPFVMEYKLAINNARAKEVVVQMVYTNVDIGSQSNGFHYFLEYALEKSAVTIYDGHSGLGGNIDLVSIRQAVNNVFHFNLNKTRYQIYFFSSCSSYAYYNDVFFAKKGGSKYLDVLTSAMETAFDGSVDVNMALIEAIGYWATTGKQVSYQQLAAHMENQDNLFGVNGDEDNPTVPLN